MKRILVIGATGNVGGSVVAQLAAHAVSVRAMVRNPTSARLPSQVEVKPGDLTQPESIEACVAGSDAVFLVWQAPGQSVADVIPRIASKVRRIVFVSNQTVRDDREAQDSVVSTLHARIERAIVASGVEWTFLRPGAFATNALLWWAPQLRAGNVVRWPCAEAHAAPIHEADIAAVAVRALIENRHAGAKYILTGPQSLTQAQQVEMLGKAIGRSLRFEEIPASTELMELSRVLPPPIAAMLLDAWHQRMDRPEIVTSTVADVTGVAARSFYQWGVDHASDFR